MEKAFQWIDGGTFNASRSREYLDQLNYDQDDEPGHPVDELRLDPLVDAYADQFFPWITVLMAEPKYFFLAPAITQAVVQYLRGQGSYKWSREKVIQQARIELRFAEACLCRSLLKNCKGKPRVIGIKKIKDVASVKPLTRKALGKDKGVAAGVNMHVVPRYLARTARLFGKNQEESALEIIGDRAADVEHPEYWWDGTDLATYVAKYGEIIVRWLNGGKQDVPIPLKLDRNEAKLLARALGFIDKKLPLEPHQLLLRKTIEAVDNQKNRELSTSRFLTRLSRSADSENQKELVRAASVCKAVGLVRLAYKATLAGERDNENVSSQLKRLSNVRLPKVSEIPGKDLSRNALEFLQKCQMKAQSPDELDRLIFKRESEIKPGRQKLLLRNNLVTVKAKHRLPSNPDNTLAIEPPFRLGNVKYVVVSIKSRLGVNR